MTRKTYLECLRTPMPSWQAAFVFYSALLMLGLLCYIDVVVRARFRYLEEIVLFLGLFALAEARYNEIHGLAGGRFSTSYRDDDPVKFNRITRMLCIVGVLFCAGGLAMEVYSLYLVSM